MPPVAYLKTDCEHCSGHIEYPSELAGQSIECPHCQQTTALPSPFTPPPAPPPPPTVIVQPPPQKKKGMGFLSGCLLVFLVLIIITAIGGMLTGSRSTTGSSFSESIDPKDEARGQIKIANWSWRTIGFDNIMEADFTITNGSRYDIKDIRIRCNHYAKSGTKIDSNTRTIYDIIKAGETRRFTKFNMGFIHSQVDSSAASIQDFVIAR